MQEKIRTLIMAVVFVVCLALIMIGQKNIGVPGLRIISLCFLPAALGIVGSTFFQAVGKGVNSLLVSLLRQLIVLLPAAFLLAKLGVVEWVWYAFPIAETFSLLATIVLYLRVYKRQIQNLEQEPSRISGPEIE